MDYKKSVTALVFADLAFLFLLGCSGLSDGVTSDILYLAAFILPSVSVLLAFKNECSFNIRLNMSGKNAVGFLPLIFPSVTVILLAATLISMTLSKLGFENAVTVYPTLTENLLRHALLPAVLEELTFRYLPLRLIARYSRRRAVLLSALLFAFIHCNLFQIPYAFLAGIVLASIDVAYGSILPSVILHLINNTVSVLSLYYGYDGVILIVLGALTALSSIFIFTRRKEYSESFKAVFADKCNLNFTYYPFLVIIPSVLAAILALL